MLNLLTKMVEPIQLLILLVDLYFSREKKLEKKVKFATTTTKKCKQEIYIYQIQNLYTQLKMLCKQTADQMCAKKT